MGRSGRRIMLWCTTTETVLMRPPFPKPGGRPKVRTESAE